MDEQRPLPAWLGARPLQVIMLLLLLYGTYNVVDAVVSGTVLLSPICALILILIAFGVTVQARYQYTGKW